MQSSAFLPCPSPPSPGMQSSTFLPCPCMHAQVTTLLSKIKENQGEAVAPEQLQQLKARVDECAEGLKSTKAVSTCCTAHSRQ